MRPSRRATARLLSILPIPTIPMSFQLRQHEGYRVIANDVSQVMRREQFLQGLFEGRVGHGEVVHEQPAAPVGLLGGTTPIVTKIDLFRHLLNEGLDTGLGRCHGNRLILVLGRRGVVCRAGRA